MNPLASSPCPLFNAKPCRRSSVRRLLPVAERQHDDRIGQHQGESEFGDIRVRRSPPPSPPASIREVSLGRRASAAIRDCQLCVQTLLEWLAAIVGTRRLSRNMRWLVTTIPAKLQGGSFDVVCLANVRSATVAVREAIESILQSSRDSADFDLQE